MYQNPTATLTMQNGKQILIEFSPEKAPDTINSFINLANSGMFDNCAIKRIMPNAIDISYTTYDQLEYKYMVASELRVKGFDNVVRLEKGVIDMGCCNQEEISGFEFLFMFKYIDYFDGK
jgi:peptidyl-prolyl cis-trans isomerase B (cyclophilin B)